ncbi:hypothetical protein C1646_726119, partial [Rhizophagus diaphanus]
MENRILVITPNITGSYLDGFKIDKVYPSSGFNLISKIPLFIMNEQAAIVYYSLIINKRIFSNPNTTILILRPVSKDIFYQEEFYY